MVRSIILASVLVLGHTTIASANPVDWARQQAQRAQQAAQQQAERAKKEVQRQIDAQAAQDRQVSQEAMNRARGVVGLPTHRQTVEAMEASGYGNK